MVNTRSNPSHRSPNRVIREPSFTIPVTQPFIQVLSQHVPDGDGYSIYDPSMKPCHYDPEITQLYLKAREALRMRDIGRCKRLCRAVSSYNGYDCKVGPGGVVTLKRQVRIRLQGMDAPEDGQYGCSEARDKLIELLCGEGKKIYSRAFYVDRHKRFVCDVYDDARAGGETIQESMIDSGFAWWHPHFDDPGTFQRKEKIAMWERKGIWAEQL